MVVADDEYIVVEGIKAILGRLGLECEMVGFAYNGIDALEVIREARPDIVITDIRMPGLDGLSLIEICREFLPDAFFVVISGYTEFEYAKRALSLGVINYIDKPVTIQKIAETIELLDQKNSKPSIVYNKISIQMDKIVDAFMEERIDDMDQAATGMLRLLRDYILDFDKYKHEIFKLLAVLVEACNDKSQDYENRCKVSYHAAEHLKNQEEAENYVFKILKEIKENMQGRKVGSSHRIIKKLLEYIEENYGESVGLNEFAMLVDMNPAYLSILFRNEVGVSYIKYLTDFRIKKAKAFLEQGMKVVEVSEKVGYVNYRYFCEIFKKHVGQTPNEYKGRIRKKS